VARVCYVLPAVDDFRDLWVRGEAVEVFVMENASVTFWCEVYVGREGVSLERAQFLVLRAVVDLNLRVLRYVCYQEDAVLVEDCIWFGFGGFVCEHGDGEAMGAHVSERVDRGVPVDRSRCGAVFVEVGGAGDDGPYVC
jgi:hypothetical protein